MASINKEWVKIRESLQKIKADYIDHEDNNLGNMAVICDLLILCTYNPEEMEPLYETLEDHIDDLLGGKN